MIRRRVLSIVLIMLVLSTALLYTGCAEVENGVSTWEATGGDPAVKKQEVPTSNVFEFGVYPQSKADATKQSLILGNVNIDETTGLWNVYEEKDENGNMKIRAQYDVASGYYIYTYVEDGKELTEEYMLCGENLYTVEPIRWYQLAEEGSESILISLNVIDGGRLYSDLYGECTWATSSMRAWLNGTEAYDIENGEKYDEHLNFLNRAFDKDAIANIKEVENKCKHNDTYDTQEGEATKDLVYLLSVDEFNKYFTSDSEINSMAFSTDYAIARGVVAGNHNESNWWLRDPGANLFMIGVDRTGKISTGGFSIQDKEVGIRPVIKVATSALSKVEAETK